MDTWERYASPEMQKIWSDKYKYTTWRKLWHSLAVAQFTIGVKITPEQLNQMAKNIDNIDLEKAKEIEKETNHDVMAHLKLYCQQAPDADPIIHLGATSSYITDNTDIILQRKAVIIIIDKLHKLLLTMHTLARQHKSLAMVGYTHLQCAQPTTLGKRICMWLSDLTIAKNQLRSCMHSMTMLGVKGATGTQASYLELLDGNIEKVKELDELVCAAYNFTPCEIASQTHSRLNEAVLASSLAMMAIAISKMCNDIRFMASRMEVEEPRAQNQVGSSAMPYKHNPISCEKATSLSRYIISLANNFNIMAAEQWLERTLDDSANRRIIIPQLFMAADGTIDTMQKVMSGLQINTKIIEANLTKYIPFMVADTILVRCKDRQEMHEKLQQLYNQASKIIKEGGELPFNIIDDIYNIAKMVGASIEPSKLIGLAAQQVDNFLA